MDAVDDFLYLVMLHHLITNATLVIFFSVIMRRKRSKRKYVCTQLGPVRYSIIARMGIQETNLDKLINTGDRNCKASFRMDRNCFVKFCHFLHDCGGLRASKYVSISEQVAMFLEVLSHHTKNVKVGLAYTRSGHTVSKYFNKVMIALLGCYQILYADPEPVDDDEENPTWECFKGCLGALDGTYINFHAPLADKGRYRCRKGPVVTNVLAVCDQDGNFVLVYPGWEGGTADNRVLQSAVTHPNGLRVPTGCYYLADGGYTNGPGFLTPYRGTRYHLKEWETGRQAPQNYKEYFNMKHAKARNVIEKCFAALKMRWAVLRNKTFYSVAMQCNIIEACGLLHNFVRREMGGENEEDLREWLPTEDDHDDSIGEHIINVQGSRGWATFRDNMAMDMYNRWMANRSGH